MPLSFLGNPLTLVLGAGATFVARSVDVFTKHLKRTLTEAHEHRGTSFVHIFQNCNIFNDGAFDNFREKAMRGDNVLELEHGKPLLFGAKQDRGIIIDENQHPQVLVLGNGKTEKDLLVHDEQGSLGYLMMLTGLMPPNFPMPVGVFRREQRTVFDQTVHEQIATVTENRGAGKLEQALRAGNTWTVE